MIYQVNVDVLCYAKWIVVYLFVSGKVTVVEWPCEMWPMMMFSNFGHTLSLSVENANKYHELSYRSTTLVMRLDVAVFVCIRSAVKTSVTTANELVSTILRIHEVAVVSPWYLQILSLLSVCPSVWDASTHKLLNGYRWSFAQEQRSVPDVGCFRGPARGAKMWFS